MTSTTATAQSACTSVINAADFSNNVTDKQRDTWTVGKLHHVVKALAGRKVAITTDTQTGHTVFNVALKRAYSGRCQFLTVAYDYGTGVTLTDHYAWTIGMIMVMPTDQMESVKWDALESYRKHGSAAIDIAKELHGETRQWGTWKATPISGSEVDVTYTPSTGNPSFAEQWGERGYWRINVQG